jgi:hypothetical protein
VYIFLLGDHHHRLPLSLLYSGRISGADDTIGLLCRGISAHELIGVRTHCRRYGRTFLMRFSNALLLLDGYLSCDIVRYDTTTKSSPVSRCCRLRIDYRRGGLSATGLCRYVSLRAEPCPVYSHCLRGLPSLCLCRPVLIASPPHGKLDLLIDSALCDIVDDRFDVTIGLLASSWRTCCDVLRRLHCRFFLIRAAAPHERCDPLR